MKRTIISKSAPLLVILVVLLIWQMFCMMLHVSEKILPLPTQIITSLVSSFSKTILPDMLISLKIMIIGYCIAIPIGFFIGAIASQFSFATRMLTPILVALMVTPMVTLVPIFKLFFGVGDGVKLLTVTLQCAPVIAVNSISGFTHVPQDKINVMKGFGCGRWETFFKVVVPNGMPQVFTGLKLGCILCTIAAISSDISIGQGGLGYRIQMEASLSNTDTAFATILVVAILGILFYYIVEKIESLVVTWK